MAVKVHKSNPSSLQLRSDNHRPFISSWVRLQPLTCSFTGADHPLFDVHPISVLAPDAFEWRRPRPIPRDPKLLPNSLVNHFVKCAKRWVPSEMPKTGLGCGYSAPLVERPVGARHGNKRTRVDSSQDSRLNPGPIINLHAPGRKG